MKMPRRVTPLRSGLAFVELGKSFQPDSACLLPAEFGHQSSPFYDNPVSGCVPVCHPCGCRFGCLLEDHSGGYRIEALRPGRVLVGLRPSEIRPSSDANRCRTGCPSRGCIWNRASEGCRGSSSHLWIGGRCDQCARSLLGVLRHLLRTPRPRRRSPTRWPIFSSG